MIHNNFLSTQLTVGGAVYIIFCNCTVLKLAIMVSVYVFDYTFTF